MATFSGLFLSLNALLALAAGGLAAPTQTPVVAHSSNGSAISVALFRELEELARIVDISYCVGTAGLGIQKPFQCASRCGEFENFELIDTWNTGPLLSDSCGYIALSHPPSPPRIILAFRGTYSIANTIVDLSTVPQEYVPYPGDDDSKTSDFVDPRIANPDSSDETPPPADPPKCTNCTVHTGFYSSWLNTRNAILSDLTEAIEKYPDYQLTLVGHSLGGAVAALAGLDFLARGWQPRVTTFGEPRIGNKALMSYIDDRFNITSNKDANSFHRVTHVSDPVPLLPLAEWGYSMHSQEIFISAPDLPPSVDDLQYCKGDEDPDCIAGKESDGASWGIPARFKLWELFFAHRDYFWRIGLCVPGGDPKDWYRKYPDAVPGDETPVEEENPEL
ncbi:alpha/beta-hydrolase [Aaosphaeria arxii CBS 175.79]|uniref:Alpha/beta-hydrolase n=1 Tax=Aaosphaeria arxii CBS 175.79 TaxID=1450172 RepID=A0A6A5XPR8_9PLEO|nr:alpha/beta-hydrolase [Aaosphaeria arxii CBS 175.79]KAF2014720.1 alpha/beta-hydrolase [Aaosphaeria arxii CBS 175.79]